MGLFSGLGSIIGGTLGFLGGRDRNRAQERINRDNIRLSWDMWNAANEYNHPAQQMARFKAAGLNPNLIYGQMSNAPAPAMVKSEVGDGPNSFDALANAIEGYESMQLQREMAEHQMRVADANVDLARERNVLQARALDDAADRAQKEFEDRSQMRELEAKKIEADIAYINSRARELDNPRMGPIERFADYVFNSDTDKNLDPSGAVREASKVGHFLSKVYKFFNPKSIPTFKFKN